MTINSKELHSQSKGIEDLGAHTPEILVCCIGFWVVVVLLYSIESQHIEEVSVLVEGQLNLKLDLAVLTHQAEFSNLLRGNFELWEKAI